MAFTETAILIIFVVLVGGFIVVRSFKGTAEILKKMFSDTDGENEEYNDEFGYIATANADKQSTADFSASGGDESRSSDFDNSNAEKPDL